MGKCLSSTSKKHHNNQDTVQQYYRTENKQQRVKPTSTPPDHIKQMMQQIEQQQLQINQLTRQRQNNQQVIIQYEPSESNQSEMMEAWVCPRNHSSHNLVTNIQFCHNCSDRNTEHNWYYFSRALQCNVCGYTICNNCFYTPHSYFCASKAFVYHTQSKLCNSCFNQKFGGSQCRQCGFNYCLQCDRQASQR